MIQRETAIEAHTTHIVRDMITTDYIATLGLLSCEAHTIIRGQKLGIIELWHVHEPKYNDMYRNTRYNIHSKYLDSIVENITHMYKPIGTKGHTPWKTQLFLSMTIPPKGGDKMT